MWRAIVNAWNGVDATPQASAEPDRAPAPTLQFQDMVQEVKTKNPDTVLVDVREPSEFEVVRIPGSINVPYKSHPNGFALPADEFQTTFNVSKPDKSKKLIFFCASGFRAGRAEGVAANDGYSNTAIYTGSMNDWVDKGGDNLKF